MPSCQATARLLARTAAARSWLPKLPDRTSSTSNNESDTTQGIRAKHLHKANTALTGLNSEQMARLQPASRIRARYSRQFVRERARGLVLGHRDLGERILRAVTAGIALDTLYVLLARPRGWCTSSTTAAGAG
ncbi:DUF6338 family protein [Streptomyces lasalocidi]